MLDNVGKLRSAEACLKDLCLKIGLTDAAHVHGDSTEERSRELIRLLLPALKSLLGGRGAAMSLEDEALESSALSEEDRLINAQSHRMGVRGIPPHLR